MNIVLATSIAVLVAAAANSLVVLRRSRDLRVWLLFAVLVLLGAAQGVALWTRWGTPLALDPATVGAFITLAASGLLVWLVRTVGRTLAELDRAETLHWSSMEAVRSLADLAEDRRIDLDARIAQMLEIGCRCFGLEIGIRSRVKGDRYEVVSIRAPEDFPIGVGAAFPVSETWCRSTLVGTRPVDVTRVEDAAWAGRSAFPFASYLGVALRSGDRAVGTLAFASLEPRAIRFSASEKDVLLLMARWVESELELLGRVTTAEATAASLPLSSGWERRPLPTPSTIVMDATEATRATPRRRDLDLNALLRRLERKLCRTAGDEVRLTLELDPELAPARDPRLPLDKVVASLVSLAAGAMSRAGEVTISTANVEVACADPDVFPAVAPARYATLQVRDDAAGVDGDALARLFDDSADEKGSLSFSSVYRMLQGCGGDLSVDVEPGRGSTWTIFLPCAETAPERAPETEPLWSTGTPARFS